MADQFYASPIALAGLPSGGVVWTPHDTNQIAHPSRTNDDGTAWKPKIVAVTVIADSTLKVTLASGDAVVVFVTAGRTSMQVSKVWSTGSTLGGSASTVFCWY